MNSLLEELIHVSVVIFFVYVIIDILPRQKRIPFIFLLLIACLISYTWVIIFIKNITVDPRHYLSLVSFMMIVFLFKKNTKWGIAGIIVFFLLSTGNLLTLTPSITTNSYWVRLGIFKLSTPSFQLMPLILLLLFLVLNLDNLINIYLDYKEKRDKTER